MDKGEFDQIFRRFYPALCTYAENMVGNLHVAQDLVEEMFISFWENSNRQNQIDQLRAYLYRATRNQCLNHLGREVRPVRFMEEDCELFKVDPEETEAEILKIEIYRQLLTAVDKLPDKCRQIITMAYMEGKASKQIAQEMNISVSTVDNQKARGLMLLRKLLSKTAFRHVLLVLTV